MSHLFFYTDDYELMLKFYTDIVSSAMFENPPSYLEKYPQTILTNYSIVVYLQKLAKDIVREVVIANAQKLNDIKQVIATHLQHALKDHQHLAEQQVTQIINTLSQAIFNKLQEIKTIYLLENISLGQLYLQDVNWKITKTISSSAKSFVGLKYPYLFTLTLYLKQSKQSSQCDQTTKAVSLQMNKIQLKQFLTQLKTIKTELN